MRTLVLYYSNTGHTRQVAEVLAQELQAELGEITCARYLRWYGPLAMAWDIFTRNLPRVDVVIPPATLYDRIIVGGPVWAARAAPPILSFLHSHGAAAHAFGLFVTCRGTSPGSPPEPAIADMKLAVNAPILGTAIFREKQIHDQTFIDSAAVFAKAFKPIETAS